MSDQAPVILVDGSSYLFRAFHAMPPLNNSQGQPTGAIKGVINMIRRFDKDFPGSKVIIVFDAKGKTFRNDMYDQYKANRPPMPDELRSQIQPIHDIIRAMGYPLLVIEGVEADDVIGTLAHEATEKGIDTVISTGDKDMAQLVSDHVTLLNTMTDVKMDREGVIEKFGLPPERIIDYLALMGDKVDNIPGVPGVGPKTAVKWLNEYESLDGIIAQADAIKGKIGEKLRANVEQLPLSYQLATIKCDVELEQGLDDIQPGTLDKDTLLSLYQTFEFRTWVTELDPNAPTQAAPAKPTATVSDNNEEVLETFTLPNIESVDYRVIAQPQAFADWLNALQIRQPIAVKLMTQAGHYLTAPLVGVSLSQEMGKAVYIPIGHQLADEQMTWDDFIAVFDKVVKDNRYYIVADNIKLFWHLFKSYGIEAKSGRDDVELQSYALNSTASKHHLEATVAKYLDEKLDTYEDIAGKGAKQTPMEQLDVEVLSKFASTQADYCLRLHAYFTHELKAQKSLGDIYERFEKPLAKVLYQLEQQGVALNVSLLSAQSQQLAQRLAELEKEAYEMAGEEFNLASPKQLLHILFEKMQLPVIKKTPKGQPSTAEPVLQELALNYPLPKLILEYRSLSKLKSTYTDKLPEEVQASTGRVHTTFQQQVTATGRLSSTDPNLQNIPIRTEEGRKIRQAFVAREGYKLVAADYSQVELRIMAHLSGDKGLLTAFNENADVHSATAAEVFGTGIEAVSADQRRSAKAINFGLIYGMSAFGLANQLNIGRKEAQEYVDTYFQRYPGVLDYMERTREQANEQGYVETIFGRRLYLPDIKARNAMLRKAAERTAINAPMQGSAADIIKQAMIDIQHWLDAIELDAKMVLQVHDELVFEVAEKDVDLLVEGVKFRMETAASLDVPLVVDVGIGDNWDEAH